VLFGSGRGGFGTLKVNHGLAAPQKPLRAPEHFKLGSLNIDLDEGDGLSAGQRRQDVEASLRLTAG